MIIMMSSPGMFHASAAYLPSSFSMYTTMLGVCALMGKHDGSNIELGILWFGIGALIGWPFSVALAAPLLLKETIIAMLNKCVYRFGCALVYGSAACIMVLVSY